MTIEKNQYGNYRVVIDYTEDNAVVIELSQAQMEQIQQHMNHQDMMENVRQALSGSSDCGRNVVDDTDYVDYIALTILLPAQNLSMQKVITRLCLTPLLLRPRTLRTRSSVKKGTVKYEGCIFGKEPNKK